MKSTLALALSLGLLLPTVSLAQPKSETKEQFNARTAWWREAKFGMFIHWGLYAVPADATDLKGEHTIGEWYLSNKHMQVKDYEKFAAQFNPVKFDAARWVKTAKDAGMKYIVITSKHHDGFCMFDSQLTDYCITKATPFKRDPMKELAAECQKQGIRLCFYHSIMDWHHPDYLPRRPWEKETRPADGADLNKYIEYMKGQLHELLTNYGPIGILWFDGGWEHNAEELHSAEVNAMIRGLQPGILINDRNRLPEDYSTPEQTIPAGALPNGRLWETCMTINDTWGYAKNDTNWKSAETLIRMLCDIAHKGGNFLLNVGPTAEGEFPEAINERLAALGHWMKVNGEAIYGTTASPFRRLSFDGRCTQKGKTLYLHVFNWPADGLVLEGLMTPVVMARALDGGENLKVESQSPTLGSGAEMAPGKVRIAKPKHIDPVATVIVLDLQDLPAVVDMPIQPDKDGTLTLHAIDAEVHGETARYEHGDGHDNIGYWTNAKDYVTWKCRVAQPGEYRVEVTYACPPQNEGSEFTVGVESGATLGNTVKATGNWTTFKPAVLAGTLKLAAGNQTIAVHVKSMPKGAVMNLKEIKLTPAK